jgi:hypothetical protein
MLQVRVQEDFWSGGSCKLYQRGVGVASVQLFGVESYYSPPNREPQ